MTMNILLYLILIPFVAGALALIMPKRAGGVKEMIAVTATLAELVLAAWLFKSNSVYASAWLGFGLNFSLRYYNFSAFIILAIASLGFLVTLYSTAFMRGKEHLNQFYSYLLISISFAAGAVLADNLIVLLFFWEGLLGALFGLIFIGNKNAFKTATKAFVIIAISDLCMMFGIIMTGNLAGTLMISKISLPLDLLGGTAFTFLMIGAISKGGSMPFHSWIPDAATDAPLPFMAIFPASIEKLLGIYFLTRISLDMFRLEPSSWVSMMMMIIGALTIIFAVMMALIQKDFKRLLSYHAISQVGYMILGIGTAVPAGIVGGLFHMINNAMYKSCLFLTGGAVEKQAGTTNLEKLGGLAKKMPVTFACFFIAAVSISGVPPFNGFFSKELIYDGALERGMVFYLAAIIGSFFTAASFLKLGHAAFLGKQNEANNNVKEGSWVMTLPMIVIALGCVIFGVWNSLPLKGLIQPVLGHRLEGHNYAGMPASPMLIFVTIVVLAGAILNHLYGLKKKRSGIKAVDHIHYAPGLHWVYDRAEQRVFDPYDIGLRIVNVLAAIGNWADKAVDWVYETFTVKLTQYVTDTIKNVHTGNFSIYMLWAIAGSVLVIFYVLRF